MNSSCDIIGQVLLFIVMQLSGFAVMRVFQLRIFAVFEFVSQGDDFKSLWAGQSQLRITFPHSPFSITSNPFWNSSI